VILPSLEVANVLKLDDEELPVLVGLLGWTGTDEERCLGRLAERFGLRAVALTRGGRGSRLWLDGRCVSWPLTGSPVPLPVVDTVGAGDSYTAALALGLLWGHPPEEILRIAHRVADFVCTRAGATPGMPEDFARELSRVRGSAE